MKKFVDRKEIMNILIFMKSFICVYHKYINVNSKIIIPEHFYVVSDCLNIFSLYRMYILQETKNPLIRA